MLESIIPLLIHYKYLIILPLAVIEGPILAIVCGFMLQLGYFSLPTIYLLLMIGDIVSDVYWYYIGYYGGRRLILKFGKYFSVTEENLKIVEKIYHYHYAIILFLSKLTMGFGFAIAIVATAGIVRIPFRKYILINILAQPIWTGILLTVGYFLGQFYVTISKGFELISFIALVIFAGVVLWGVSRFVRKKIIETYS